MAKWAISVYVCTVPHISTVIWRFRSLRWRHNELDGVSDHQPHDCLLNCLFGRGSKKTSKLRVTGLCVGNSPGTGEFSAQMASNAENVSIWWRHHGLSRYTGQGSVITSHGVLWDVITYTCPRNLFLAPKSSYNEGFTLKRFWSLVRRRTDDFELWLCRSLKVHDFEMEINCLIKNIIQLTTLSLSWIGTEYLRFTRIAISSISLWHETRFHIIDSLRPRCILHIYAHCIPHFVGHMITYPWWD